MKGIIQKIAAKLRPTSQPPQASQAAPPTSAPADVLNRLKGKKVLLQGRFSYGVKEYLTALTEAQKGKIVEDLDKAVEYLVLADLSGGKGAQQKALSLNAKGATIQVVDADTFGTTFEPTDQDVLALIQQGTKSATLFNEVIGNRRFYRQQQNLLRTIVGENFDNVDLSGFHLFNVAFEKCDFISAALGDAFASAKNCNFSKAVRMAIDKHGSYFGDVEGSRFVEASLGAMNFNESIAKADFSRAMLDKASFHHHGYGARNPSAAVLAGVVFKQTSLKGAMFTEVRLDAPNFENADCSHAVFANCTFSDANFRKAKLLNTSLVDCKLPEADFSGADLSGSTLAGSDLTGARFDGADLTNCNLRGAILKDVDLSKAKGYAPTATVVGAVGPALTELDSVGGSAKRVRLTFKLTGSDKDEGDEVSIDTTGLRYGWGIRSPLLTSGITRHARNATISAGLLTLAQQLGHRKVRYETVEVQSTKSPKGGKELRELVIKGIAEAFAQPAPSDEDLAKATKAHRETVKTKTSATREQREEYKRRQEQLKKREIKKIEKKIEKTVGKVTDIASFLKALELRADPQKIKKATSMLKADRFKLFNDVTDDHLSGVMKSQSDPDLVYACRIDQNGQYGCCTQNLNICGGLRGSICKHLLVLIIGLVKANELDPEAIDGWVSKTNGTKPVLDKEKMGEIFIRYKGAEAGEVDWRPTETVPEDYYAL